jgi:nucleotide-binding universal stress UspA family protein
VATILSEASAVGAGLIVVGAHRHARARRLLLGSVSSALLRQATCPVTVVPAAD